MMRCFCQSALFVVLVCLLSCSSGNNLITDPPDDGGNNPPPASSWSVSACTSISGSSYLGLTTDDGISFIDDGNHALPSQNVFSFGLAVIGVNRLAAVAGGRVLVSEDAGCAWTEKGQVDSQGVYLISAADDQVVYIYSPQQALFYSVNLTSGQTTALQAPLEGISALWADAANPQSIRLSAGPNRRLYDSLDGGASFTLLGSRPQNNDLNYFSVINKNDPNHIIQGTIGTDTGTNGGGVWTSLNGGSSWTQAQGFVGRVNAFTGHISEANSNLVWVLGLDLDDDSVARRKIYRSIDGGLSFAVVLSATNGVPLNNSTELWPDTARVNHLFFAITDPSNVLDRSTTLYHYNHDTGTLQPKVYPYQNSGEIRALSFNPDHEGNIFFTKTFQVIVE